MDLISPKEIAILLFSLGILLLIARFLGEVFEHFKQPAVIGEIFAGILLGPTVLGTFFPEINQFLFPSAGPRALILNGFTTIAITLFLLVAGMEVDLSSIWRQGKSVIILGIAGTITPFIIAFIPAYISPHFFGIEAYADKLIFALFFATALSISALPVVAKILMDLNIYKTDLGMIIIAAATFEDLAGGILFAIILGMSGNSEFHNFGIGYTILLTIVFAVFILSIVRLILHNILPWIQAHTSWPGGILSFSISIALFAAAFTEWIGVHAIFGAFLIGIAIGDSSHLREHTRTMINQFISFIFAPIFFASIGLKVNFISNFDLGLVLTVMIIACIGKLFGSQIGSKLAKISTKDSWAIGFGLNARGAIEIIFGLLALQYNLISEKVFVALVVMALLTSIISGPLIKAIIKPKRERRFTDFISQKTFLRNLSGNNKIDVINELSILASNFVNINSEEIKKLVMERESIISTGIGNSVAVPHARVNNLKSPIIAVGLSNSGIDFDSPDGESAQIIFLILTPSEDASSQIEILADIARNFRNSVLREKTLKVNNFTEFKALIMTSTEK